MVKVNGSLVSKLREQQGWTQNDLAIKSKLSQSYIQQIEAQKVNPSLNALAKVAKALNVPLTDLVMEVQDNDR